MKVISLTQPWATLVVLGAKRFETRSWSTKYRGPLLIHASKRFTREDKDLCCDEPFMSALAPVWKYREDDVCILPEERLPLGAIIGQVDLVDCQRTEKIAALPFAEIEFGDFSNGHFAWKLENPGSVRYSNSGKRNAWVVGV